MRERVRHFARCLISIGILTQSGMVQASDAEGRTVQLEPTAPWTVDYGDDKCRLYRPFGEGDQATILAIDRYAPGDSFHLLVAGAPLARFPAARTRMRFGPNGGTSEASLMAASLNDKPALISSETTLVKLGETVVTSVEATGTKRLRRDNEKDGDPAILDQKLKPEEEAKVTDLTILGPQGRQVRLGLGPMGKPMAALRACMDELVTHWGIDVPAHRALSRSVIPIGNPAAWIGTEDYPLDLLATASQGVVHFRLAVGIDGRPTACTVQSSTRPAGFDKAVCASMVSRARFEPALDRGGNPVASFWSSTVRFEMP